MVIFKSTMRFLHVCGLFLIYADKKASSGIPVPQSLESPSYMHPASCENNTNSDSGRRIIGGEDASVIDYPFAVALQTKYRTHKCGASLIHPSWILTAAHCVVYTNNPTLPLKNPANYLAVMGSDDVRRGKGSKTIQIREPAAFYRHPEFNHHYMQNDIGLIKLKNKFNLSKEVNTVRLPMKEKELGKDQLCTVIGWGFVADIGHGESEDPTYLAERLQKVDVPIIPTLTCQHYYTSDVVTETSLCAGYDIGGRDACAGDSGGSLMCGGVQRGITSWGYRCAYPKSPGVYTRIDKYISWIKDVTLNSKDELKEPITKEKSSKNHAFKESPLPLIIFSCPLFHLKNKFYF